LGLWSRRLPHSLLLFARTAATGSAALLESALLLRKRHARSRIRLLPREEPRIRAASRHIAHLPV
jgi:hypothetical protein